MKVITLIEKLNRFPKDLVVYLEDRDSGDYLEATKVELVKDAKNLWQGQDVRLGDIVYLR